jgi:beta-lactamase regulating signal transducer with metallopeptidase domain
VADMFVSVLNMSLTASYVILVIILVRLPLKKAPKAISYALWSAAGFRLLCPFSFESILSLLPIKTAPIPQDIAYRQIPQIDSGVFAVDAYVNSVLPAPVAEASVNPLQIYIQTGAYIWLSGIAVMLVYSVVSILILNNRLKGARHTELNIYEADNLKTPFVLGIFRYKIYIPAGLTQEEGSYIIRHEQTHIRRLDHVIKPFAFLILSIHWFNPLVWIAFVLMSTDMELSCDERVIREMGGKIKKAYSASLLSLATGRHVINGSPLAFGEGNVKGRIKNVLNYKKPAFWIITLTVIAVIIIGTGLIANPRSAVKDGFGEEAASDTSAPEADGAGLPTAMKPSFTSTETDLIKLGTIAFDQYMSSLTSEATPVNERIASYKLNDISILAGDISEFCVSLNYDFTTDNESYVNPPRGAKGEGTWPDNYMEIRIKHAEGDKYEIVGIGTGGGGQGLEPYAPQRTALEPVSPELSLEQTVSVDMAELDYASDDIIIFHDYFGLFVYDLNTLEIVRSLDLKPLNCHYTQGDNYCEVSVSADGNTVQLHPMSSENMYIYTVSDNTLWETAYQPMEERFSSFIPTEELVHFKVMAHYSHHSVKFAAGDYGYLYTADWTIATLSYSRGDIKYSLFELEEN